MAARTAGVTPGMVAGSGLPAAMALRRVGRESAGRPADAAAGATYRGRYFPSLLARMEE